MMGEMTFAPESEIVYALHEGWWEAILMDEEAQMEEDGVAQSNPCAPASASFEINWACVEQAHHQDALLTVVVVGMNKRSLLVKGPQMNGFLPASHLVDVSQPDLLRQRRQILSRYLGRELRVKVMTFDPCADRVVFSERAALGGQGRREEVLQTISDGAIVEGVVTNITHFGAFIDLGGVEGLLHLSEISWGRVQHPTHVLQVGQKLQLVVVAVNKQNGRVSLSLKRLCSNPWEVVAARYRAGDVVTATITSMTEYGAFVRLQEGVDGLIHISSLDEFRSRCPSWHPLHPGQCVQARIVVLDVVRRRLGLTLVCVE